MTVRVMGPMVSWVGWEGIMPWTLTSPSVGRSPTRLATAAGPRMEPAVSSPIPTSPKLAATPAEVPPEEPLGFRSGA